MITPIMQWEEMAEAIVQKWQYLLGLESWEIEVECLEEEYEDHPGAAAFVVLHPEYERARIYMVLPHLSTDTMEQHVVHELFHCVLGMYQNVSEHFAGDHAHIARIILEKTIVHLSRMPIVYEEITKED